MVHALTGVRVLDLTTVVLGPYCTQILADLGADVIKVESLDGDSTRYIGAARHPGMGSIFLNLNRNKRSLAIDLKRPQGRDILAKLAAQVDVFIHSMRPQAIERLGLAAATLCATNPKLVYCVATGYGLRGQHAGKPAYDDVIQAMSGLALLQGRGGNPPDYCVTVIADKVAGLSAVYGIMAALLRRHMTGVGDTVEVPMFETTASFVLAEHIGGYAFEPPIGPASYARITTPYRRPYRTRDGYIAVIVYTDRHWQTFLNILNRPSLIGDPRFASFGARTEHVDFLYRLIEEALLERGTNEWLTVLTENDIPAMPVLSTEELFAEPHLNDVGFFVDQTHPTEGRLRLPRQPVRFGSGDPPINRPAPRLGEHSIEVLRNAGIADTMLRELIKQGVVIDNSRREHE